MKGDYYRYISEYTTGPAHDKAGSSASDAYKAATEIAEKGRSNLHDLEEPTDLQ
jgi:hypothetical protein